MDSVFLDYQRLVMEYYQRKKGLHLLRSALDHPTQAKLKKESLRLCQGKISGKDEKVIKDFCEKWDDEKTCFQNLVKYDADKFKPLSNYLKNPIGNTDPKYIELLAWLIEFPNRPYDYYKDYTGITVDDLLKPQVEANGNESSLTQSNLITVIEGGQIAIDKKPPGEENMNSTIEDVGSIVDMDRAIGIGEEAKIKPGAKPKQRYRKVLTVGALLVVIAGGGYLWWDTRLRYNMSFEHGGCMYWTEDHYQPIPCNQKIPNTIVVALDSVKIRSFKKITQPDTITHRAIGSVWYSKINNKVEFFTADGDHPVVIDRHLKPVTKRIIDKYARQDTTSSNSQASFLSN